MEAAFEGAAKAFMETSRVAFRWLKDTHSLTREQGTKVEKNGKSIQESIENNVKEIFCVKANHEVQVDRIGRLDILVKSQETTLIS